MESYKEFINKILLNRGRFNCFGYKERHHILPKSLGGADEENNMIDLYPQEHYEAHRLLALENPSNQKLTYAWWLMSNVKNEYQQRYKISAEEYAEARCKYSELMKQRTGVNSPNYGKHMSEEQREKLSKAHKGKHLSKEIVEKMKESHKGLGARGNNPMAKKVECDGMIFDCIEDCADYYNISYGSMKMWLSGGNKMPTEFIEKNLRYSGDSKTIYKPQTGNQTGSDHHNSKRVICDGKIYGTLKECCDFYGIKPATMCAWLKGRNKMPENFRQLNLSYLKEGDCK